MGLLGCIEIAILVEHKDTDVKLYDNTTTEFLTADANGDGQLSEDEYDNTKNNFGINNFHKKKRYKEL